MCGFRNLYTAPPFRRHGLQISGDLGVHHKRRCIQVFPTERNFSGKPAHEGAGATSMLSVHPRSSIPTEKVLSTPLAVGLATDVNRFAFLSIQHADTQTSRTYSSGAGTGPVLVPPK